jgi:hypothetical protein
LELQELVWSSLLQPDLNFSAPNREWMNFTQLARRKLSVDALKYKAHR